MSTATREQWGSGIGFILAAIGSAVGLGNIWRFSYLTYENGGGAFLVPYVIALLLVGIPVLLLEMALGHHARVSTPRAFATIDPRFSWIGWWAVVFVMFGIEAYYCVIIAWCGDYFAFSPLLAWGADANDYFFHQFLHLGDSHRALAMSAPNLPIFVSLVVVWGLNWWIVGRGISGGIELANKVMIPALFVIVLVLVGWSLMLPGGTSGIHWYLTPDWGKLADPKVWVAAFTQIFFTLSVGFGIMTAYASYLPDRANLTRYAIVTALSNSAVSFIAGFAVFATLGFMAHQSGKPFEEVVTQSIGLAFVAYPQAISSMPFLPQLFGMLFFGALFMAGLSSSISLIEAFTTALTDKLGVARRRVVTPICAIGFLLSCFFTMDTGLFWLDIVDHFVTNYALTLVVALECIVVGWFFGGRRFHHYVLDVSGFRFARHYEVLMRLLLTLGLALAWVGFFMVEGGGIGAFLARICILVAMLAVWLARDWFDMAVRFVIPVIALALLDRGMVTDISKPYGGYPWEAVILLGGGVLAVTLLVALVLDRYRPREGAG
ncbi:MAG: sodium-dependent transporter [Zetaproteobacteria bacterium]|nr:MAG: sodium-dependent transporter [Zetaproteobacteria bacterium]